MYLFVFQSFQFTYVITQIFTIQFHSHVSLEEIVDFSHTQLQLTIQRLNTHLLII